MLEASGTHGVGVKSVDIVGNTEGEGSLLGHFLTLSARKRGHKKGLDKSFPDSESGEWCPLRRRRWSAHLAVSGNSETNSANTSSFGQSRGNPLKGGESVETTR